MADSEEVKGVVMVEGSEEEEAGKVGSLEAAKEVEKEAAMVDLAEAKEANAEVAKEAAKEEALGADSVAEEVEASNIVRAHLPMMK